ncbi:hypothetical protein C1H46_025843 [Malus baccata]|uniref:BRO1 domain-containing protein n=1 Tax=Malus baccata TaxID=106549 RepID=A0A540LQ21_MALBA|nr:hypothetical protein C1H46_025843 [Malus baccata]
MEQRLANTSHLTLNHKKFIETALLADRRPFDCPSSFLENQQDVEGRLSDRRSERMTENISRSWSMKTRFGLLVERFDRAAKRESSPPAWIVFNVVLKYLLSMLSLMRSSMWGPEDLQVRRLQRAMKENDRVYLMRVPSPGSLPPLLAFSMVKPLAMSEILDVGKEKMFASLVPDSSVRCSFQVH